MHCLQRSVAFGQDIAIGEAFAKWIEKYKEKQRFRFSNTEIVLEPISYFTKKKKKKKKKKHLYSEFDK